MRAHRPLSRRSRRFVPLLTTAVLVIGVAACGSDVTVEPTTSTAPTTTPPPPTTAACTQGSNEIPPGAAVRQVIDLDGDGRPDTAWAATATSGMTTVGVTTAAGGGTQRKWNSASPVMRSVLVIDVNDSSPPLILADDGRRVQLWTFSGCSIVDVTDTQGEPFLFELGFADHGTGVGCSVVDETNQLVTLDVTNESDLSVEWTASVVEVTGTRAESGPVVTGIYAKPVDGVAIERLRSVGCGTQTIEHDGISIPQ